MADGYKAWVEVLPDFSKFDRAARTGITSNLSDAGTAGGKVAGRNIGAGILGGIKGIAGPIVAAVAALGLGKLIGDGIVAGISYSLDGVNLAANLAESTNAVQVAFGDLGDEVLALSNLAPQRLNLTRAAFNSLAVRFSSFARTIAGDGGDVAGVLDVLTSRGADFASVYNIEATEALGLFQSGLAGETEPLRRFGLDLSAAAVEAYAYATGIAAAGEELTEAEKVQARYGLLLQQTAQVQGDLANTSGAYANQQREFAVALEEAQTKFGEAILPSATSFLQFANEELIPIISEALEEVAPVLAESIKETLPELKGLLLEVAEVLPDAARWFGDELEKDLQFMSDIIKISQGDFSPIIEANKTDFQRVLDDFAEKSDAEKLAYYQSIDVAPPAELLVGAVKDTLAAARPGSEAAANEFGGAIANQILNANRSGISSQIPSVVESGKSIADGLAAGMRAKLDAVEAAGTALGVSVKKSIDKALKIQSPSREMMESGRFAGEGFALGLAGTSSLVETAAKSVARAALPDVSASANVASAGGGVRDVTLVTQDPWVAAQMLKQELGGALVGVNG